MQYLTYFIVFSGALVNALGIHKAHDHACAPNEHEFAHHDHDKSDCTFDTKTSTSVTYSCGTDGGLLYNFKANTITLTATSSALQGLTVHAACLQNGAQVAHLDLHMPTEGGFSTQHTFSGLNRKCDLGRAHNPPKITFSTYTLRPAELTDCLQSPVYPIGF